MSKQKKPKAARAWALAAWLVARGDTPLRVILRSDVDGCANMMLRMAPDEQIYQVTVRPAPARRRKARRKP